MPKFEDHLAKSHLGTGGQGPRSEDNLALNWRPRSEDHLANTYLGSLGGPDRTRHQKSKFEAYCLLCTSGTEGHQAGPSFQGTGAGWGMAPFIACALSETVFPHTQHHPAHQSIGTKGQFTAASWPRCLAVVESGGALALKQYEATLA